jgi:enoyl-CoA hydratase/carnithine racemase
MSALGRDLPKFKYVTIQVDTELMVAHMQLAREASSNALNMQMWGELKSAVDALGAREDVRVIVLSGRGKNFCGGIDLESVGADLIREDSCPARTRSSLLYR